MAKITVDDALHLGETSHLNGFRLGEITMILHGKAKLTDRLKEGLIKEISGKPKQTHPIIIDAFASGFKAASLIEPDAKPRKDHQARSTYKWWEAWCVYEPSEKAKDAINA